MSSLLAMTTAQAESINILTTIRPLYGLVKSVVGDKGEVHVLIEQNQSPHHYQLVPSDVAKVKNAKLIFMIDNNFEYGLAAMLKKRPAMARIVRFSKNPKLHLLQNREEFELQPHDHDHDCHHHEREFDLHFWLDPNNALVMVNQIAEILAKHDPDSGKFYQANALVFAKKLAKIDQELQGEFAKANAPFISFHDAYQYYSQHYHLQDIGAVIFNHNITPGLKTIEKMQEIIHKYKVKCLFAEPQYSSSIIEKIAADTGVRTGLIDSEYGAGLPLDQDIYFNMITALAAEMQGCFGG